MSLIHILLLGLSFLGHVITWMIARSVPVYPEAWFVVALFYSISSLLGTFAIFFLSDLYFSKPENTKKKKYYFILPFFSIPICLVMATYLGVDPESEHIKKQQQQFKFSAVAR